MAAQVRAEGWHSDEVEADHLAMLTATKQGTDVLLPIAQAVPFESSRPMWWLLRTSVRNMDEVAFDCFFFS